MFGLGVMVVGKIELLIHVCNHINPLGTTGLLTPCMIG